MVQEIKNLTIKLIETLYQKSIAAEDITVNQTPPEFEGDFTVVTFPMAKAAGQRPDVVANALGEAFKKEISAIESFNVVKGFLNLKLSDAYWVQFLRQHYNQRGYGPHVLINYDKKGHLKDWLFAKQQNAGSMLKILGYENKMAEEE